MRERTRQCLQSAAKRALHAVLLSVALFTGRAAAFPMVVQPGDTLAGLAERIYGRVENESLLVAANGLDASGGIAIAPGMRIEVPAVSYRRVAPGDTWPALATELLGAPQRSAVLAFANDSKPWLLPTENAEILVPYNLRFVAEGSSNLVDVAERFLGSQKRTWMLAEYNGLKEALLDPGQVILVPLTELTLTEAGREAARRAATAWSGVGGEARAEQATAARALPALLADARAGRYVEVVARGAALLDGSDLTTLQRASIHRQLLEAYVALGANGRAAAACREWQRAAPRARLDPARLSPKLIAVCRR